MYVGLFELFFNQSVFIADLTDLSENDGAIFDKKKIAVPDPGTFPLLGYVN
jgi:hypothetical protein